MLLRNYIGGTGIESSGKRSIPVRNPATGQVLCESPLGTQADVDRAVSVAAEAFRTWRAVPLLARVRTLFRFKALLESNFEDIARLITLEHGMTLDEARGSLRRGTENIAHACGAPSLALGDALADVAAGIDVATQREPIGVFVAVTPFNFPTMVPLWFLPYAVATGNTFVLKPSERVPQAVARMFELASEAGFPAGVVNLVFGDADTSRELVRHPSVAGVSFVGKTDGAREIYRLAADAGKRVQAFGSAKNHLVVMPDAVLDRTVASLLDSCFGCAGQRCLAGSVIIAVDDVYDELLSKLSQRARAIVVGDGLDPGVTMGPMAGADLLDRVSTLIDAAVSDGASAAIDGRALDSPQIRAEGEAGAFIGPTILTDVPDGAAIAEQEVFGPVMVIQRASSVDDAIATINGSQYANTTAIFTSSGRTARQFARNSAVPMVGINIGVSAPIAAFPFGGAKQSFFGDLKAQGADAIRFFTDHKVVISRWF